MQKELLLQLITMLIGKEEFKEEKKSEPTQSKNVKEDQSDNVGKYVIIR